MGTWDFRDKEKMRLIFLIILGAILTSSTFSPQYLAWVAPFVAFLTPFESGLFIVSSCLTWLYFRFWGDVLALQPFAISILTARNIILCLLFVISFVILIKKRK